jgi:pimeloyl-ACP methyl ester carboxylesterase
VGAAAGLVACAVSSLLAAAPASAYLAVGRPREDADMELPARLVLPDGRRLAYVEYGDSRGQPALYCHGFPGSRLEAALADASAAHAGVRLIAADRPGIGGSDRQSGRRLVDWPADLARLADHLGLARFTLVGVSGGAPYALACARAMPERLDAVAVVSGVAPLDGKPMLDGMLWPNALALRAAQATPWAIAPGLQLAVLLRWFPRFPLGLVARSLDAPDRRALARHDVREIIVRSLREALRQGARGVADDLLLLCRSWGFRLDEIAVPVYLWHGERDRMVPASHSRRLCAELARSHCRAYPDEGHFSLVIEHAADIFAALDDARRAGVWR